MEIHLINGPNLNLVGRREPEIYGSQDLKSHFEELRKAFPEHKLHYFQSNHEGYILDYLHDVGFMDCGIVLNAGALTHTSIALSDAVKAIHAPVVEVHISDIHKREKFRTLSYIKEHCINTIMGKGLKGYELAIQYLINYYQ